MSSLSEKDQLLPLRQPHAPRSTLWTRVKAVLCIAALSVFLYRYSSPVARATSDELAWSDCGSGIECSTLEVPMDWAKAAERGPTVTLALARLPANSTKGRLGSIIVNPGGPGGSGTSFIFSRGLALSTIVEGRYDIVSFDPRGINRSTPHISCFQDKLSEHIFQTRSPTGSLNIPVNFTSISSATGLPSDPAIVTADIEAQVRVVEATVEALFANCAERSGEEAAFVGTQSVVKDIDLLSRTLDGPKSKINFIGYSYGTIIGQYMTAILSPERLGKVVIDGVVDAVAWNGHATGQLTFGGLDDIDGVYSSFADSCLAAKDNCSLASLGSASAILSAIDGVIDALYHSPASLPTLPAADFVGKSYHAKRLLFKSAYSIKTWPDLAEHFAQAHFLANHTGLVNATLSYLTESVSEAANKSDSSALSTVAISCADSRPYNDTTPSPSSIQIASYILDSLDRFSSRSGDAFFALAFCHLWPVASQSYYGGGFTMLPSSIESPVLILSQKFDPVTPLASAKKALRNLGSSNARLVEQNGSGHCSISQASLCTAKIVRAYFVDGVAPADDHTFCKVDQLPFQPYNLLSIQSVEEQELMRAWASVADVVGMPGL